METPEEFILRNQENILLEEYTLKDMEWFMIEFAKYYHKQQLKLTRKNKRL